MNRCLVFLIATALPTVSFASDELSIEVHSSVLEQSINIGQDSLVTPINRYIDGVYTLGSAFTTTNIQQSLSPTDGAAALQLSVQSHTNSMTHSQTWPKPRILIDFNAVSDTSTTAWKTIYLTEAGFSQSQTSVSAASNITFYDLQTSSWGLFWRLKSRIAYNAAQREIMNQKASQEAELSAEVARQLATTIDARTNDLLAPLQTFYVEKFYRPIVEAGELVGKLKFLTSGDRFAIFSGSSSLPTDSVSADSPIAIRVGFNTATSIASKRLNGRQFTGSEVLSSLLGDKIPADVKDALDVKKLEATVWKFRADDSFLISSGDSDARITMFFAQLKVGSESIENVEVTMPILIEEDDGRYLIDLDTQILAVRSSGEALSTAEITFVRSAIRNVIPPVSVEISGIALNIGKLSLGIGSLSLTDEKIDLKLSANRTASQLPDSVNNVNADIVAWCTDAGAKWLVHEGYGHCDCGSQWIREDAIRLFSLAEFKNRCK